MPITLTKEQIQNINSALATIKEAKTEILKAKQAGIDLSEQEQALQEQETRLLAIKRVYTQARS